MPRRLKRFFRIVVGIGSGLLLGTGAWVYVTQAGNFDPLNKAGIAFPVVGVLIGLVASIFGGPKRHKKRKKPAGA
jgi:hypothetical protein